ncbi:hypothetical protein DL770_010940 [Monosporascus sp. CRB-9-2]|nr:hypothetical protein DL770_010940 [Monosporascus sp. CRB-9-2]
MASLFTPDERPYLLYRPFYAPTETGNIWAIAFSNRSGAVVTAALSICIALIALCLWDLVRVIALLFESSPSCRRFVAQATIWNCPDPWVAFQQLARHSYLCIPPPTARRFLPGWRDALFGIIFAIAALAIYGGSAAMGTFLPVLIQFGTVAPARPSAVFYPALPDPTDLAGILLHWSLLVPMALRALANAEVASLELQSRLKTAFDETGTTDQGDPEVRFAYNYSLTGVDLGLQFGSDLTFAVDGSCETAYEWSADDPEEANRDIYQLWGDPHLIIGVPLDVYSTQQLPSTSFAVHPDSHQHYNESGNTSFAIIPWTAHRSSITEGSDVWFVTETINSSVPRPFNASFWMKRHRPALSCWQRDKWSYRGQTVRSVYDLRSIPDIKIPLVLLRVLEDLQIPRFIRIGNMLGQQILLSRSGSPNGVIDASRSSLESSMALLALASYIASRDVLLETTQFGDFQQWSNLFRGPDGAPADGADGFVISRPDVQTFSIVGMIILTALVAALLLLRFVVYPLIAYLFQRADNKNTDGHQRTGWHGKGGNADKWTRFNVLSTDQLLRCVYEQGTLDDDSGPGWDCQSRVPPEIMATSFRLDKCGRARCKGHIIRDTANTNVAWGSKVLEGSVQSHGGLRGSSPRVVAGHRDRVCNTF